MPSPYRLSLLSIIIAAFTATSVNALNTPEILPGRFSYRGQFGKAASGDVTEAEAHAKWLTSRKPTQRSE